MDRFPVKREELDKYVLKKDFKQGVNTTVFSGGSSTQIIIGAPPEGGGGGGGGGGTWVDWLTGIDFVIGDGVVVISTGQAGHLEVPFNCTLQRVTLLADQAGSIVVDIWKDTYAGHVASPASSADSICGTTKPTLAGSANYQDTVLEAWSTTFTEGDILAYNVNSCGTITRLTVAMAALRSA